MALSKKELINEIVRLFLVLESRQMSPENRKWLEDAAIPTLEVKLGQLQEAFVEREKDTEVERRLAEIRADVDRQRANDPERIRQQEQDEREAARVYRDYYLTQIFNSVVPGYGVPVRNVASENIVLGWLQPGETLTPDWFRKVLAEQPELAKQIQWQSADVLDPQKQRAKAKAQLEQDQITFSDAARAIKTFGVNMANFRLTREVLGEGFSQYAIQQALASNALQLSPPSREELTQWANDSIEAHNEALLKANPEELRARVREESVARQQSTQQEQAQRQIQAETQRDAALMYPALPVEITSDIIKKGSPDQIKYWCRKFGHANVNARLQNRS